MALAPISAQALTQAKLTPSLNSILATLNSNVNELISLKLDGSGKNAASGYAATDGSGKIDSSVIPATVADLASPAFTGTPTAPTAAAGTNTTQIATTQFVTTAVANVINAAPGALDTLKELADAINDDASFAATVTTALAGKVATSVTVAGHALSANVAIAAADLTNGTTGTGAAVLATSPTLVTPVLGAATATTINGVAISGGGSFAGTSSGTNTGDVAYPTGTFLGMTVLTSASANFTPGAHTNTISVRIQAAGGGGGGTASTSSIQCASAGGGGAGGYAEKNFAVTPSTPYAYTMDNVGGAGAGPGNSTGTDGGNSTFVVGGTTVTVNGGKGGVGSAAGTAGIVAGGLGGAVGTFGDVNEPGGTGGPGVKISASVFFSGKGGDSALGGGAAVKSSGGNGNSATGHGGGGGGAASATSDGTGKTGGNGAPGLIVVYEYA